MKPLLRKLRRRLGRLLVVAQLLLWLLGLGGAAEPAQIPETIDSSPTQAPTRTVVSPDSSGVPPGPAIG